MSVVHIPSTPPEPALRPPLLAMCPHADRVRVSGKFLTIGDEPFFVRGVTYGPFRPDGQGCEYGTRDKVSRDFALMARAGVNSVRLYTVPPRWLMDEAQARGLKVMVGLPWEQHVAFLNSRHQRADIVRRVREAARVCAGHPALLCYAVGNEIPAPIVRWHGRRSVENFLRQLYWAVKDEDPEALVTYVNYPSTEYLDVSFADIFSFNVYLENRAAMEAYLARLQNLSEDRPLLLAEVGLDSIRNGEDTQAEILRWQIDSVFAGGAAGLYVFSWTDEWHRGGEDIHDWAFGLTTVGRAPKPALDAVQNAFTAVPFPENYPWPRMSVLVCTYNGSATIQECLEGLQRLDYPDYEVIVVSDGSTDSTEAIVQEYDVRLIKIPNHGLSHARNVAAKAATGDFVAYIDDDAYPDPYWLKYLAYTFTTTDCGAVGGPNLPPSPAGWAADCVANSPGGPTHVLLSDRVAEHIPGCNMAYRRDLLLSLGGFDEQFRIAGDDVDLCWRLRDDGHYIAFSPAAVVWHHRRNSVRAYLRQQRNYGRAEATLEAKWPQKYNAVGHIQWRGRIYGQGVHRNFLPGRSRIYHGVFGLAPFQRVYEPGNDLLHAIAQMPEWYLLMAALAVLSLVGLSWPPLLLAAPLLALTAAIVLLQAVLGAKQARFTQPSPNPGHRIWKRCMTGMLHVLQPLVRLEGRLRGGLTPWRRRGSRALCFPRVKSFRVWCETWISHAQRIFDLAHCLREKGGFATPAGNFSSSDLVVRGGLLGAASLLMTVEEHGQGTQLVRYRVRPVWRRRAWLSALFFGLLALAALMDDARLAGSLLVLTTMLIVLRAFYECAIAMTTIELAIHDQTRASLDGTSQRPDP
jgi:O-antigen biosynthesis protein